MELAPHVLGPSGGSGGSRKVVYPCGCFHQDPARVLDLLPMTLREIPPSIDPYWGRVAFQAWSVGSDGCTGVPDFYRDTCLEHDVHWRTGHMLDGTPLTLAKANRRFRWAIQARSPFGRLSPMSWWRWAGVTVAGWFSDHWWRQHKGEEGPYSA